MSYSSEVLADTPIMYYRLGEASGTVMTDSSGNGRDGTYANSPTLGATGLLTGDADTAVSFASASSQSGSVADDNSLDSLSAITVEAWIKPSTVSSTPLIVNRDSTSNGKSFQFRLNAGKLEFVKTAGTTVTAASSSTLSTGTVYHVAAVYNGTDIRLYINGSLNGTPPAATGTLGTIARPLEIAMRTSALYFNGVIDEVAVYGTALSATRIAAHYTAGTTSNAAAGSAALSLSGSGVVAAPGAGSGALALSGSGAAKAPAAGSGALALSGSGAADVPGTTGAGSLSLSGSGVTTAAMTAAGALSLSGLADTFAPSDGAMSLALASSANAAAVASGSGSLELSGVGVADYAHPASGAGTLELVGFMPDPAAGSAFLELVASGVAQPMYLSDTSNTFSGLQLVCLGTVTIIRAAVAPPSNVAVKQDKALPYPRPVMVGGRPT